MKTIKLKIKILFLLTFTLFSIETFAQSAFREIEIIKEIPTTSVKDQANTGTCWSFGTTSFIESELIRMGKGEFDLSEMFTIRCTYEDHAEMFVRYHGNLNFGSGAEGWDLFNVVKNYGIVPQEAYPGLLVNPKMHDHGEMDQVLKAMAEVLVNQNKLTMVWNKAISGVLDVYLGDYPNEFDYKGKTYTPESFRDYLGIDVESYWSFTSFTNHPYYTEIVFESPDNWSNGTVKNVKLDDLIEIINNALLNGYSVVWASDVSDPGFDHKKGLAIVPEKDWTDMNEDEKAQAFVKPIKQKEITPEQRQIEFDNYETTDDHLMHMIGIAKDKNGSIYYKVKNSWGNNSNDLGGFFYASEAYVRLKTMTIALHKEAVPKKILKSF